MIHQSRLILHLSRPVDAGKLRAKPIRDVGQPSAAAPARCKMMDSFSIRTVPPAGTDERCSAWA